MIQKTFQNETISALGFGCMRLPCDGDYTHIDRAATARMVAYAMEHGVNYFDTAWGYHDGQSEIVMGEILSEYPRDAFYLADKFPGYDLSNMPRVAEIFEEQLKRCRVDYFDFYLFHNVCESNIEQYLDPQFGIDEYLRAQKENGRIRHLGFSCHGQYDVLKRFLEAYGDHMEFCQLQINYLDWHFQHADEKVALLAEYGIPVWVMEPLRGGSLAKLPAAREAVLRSLRPDESTPAFAFRFAQSLPEVTVILSGMSDERQLIENVEAFREEKPLTAAEMDALMALADEMMKQGTVPCTACRYCTAHCPMELDIPYLISLYNEHSYSGGGFIAPMAIGALAEDKRPAACVGCRSCEQVCPQQIAVSEVMAAFADDLKE